MLFSRVGQQRTGEMKNLNWNISLVLLVLLLAFSFVPFPQLTIIYFNSLLVVSLSECLFQSRDTIMFNAFNILGVLFSFFGFFISKETKYRVLFLCCYVFFAIPLLTLNTAETIYDMTPYFLPSVIHSAVLVFPIFLAELYQNRR
jgi:hypothetical protein